MMVIKVVSEEEKMIIGNTGAVKQMYSAPTLLRYGNVRELTQTISLNPTGPDGTGSVRSSANRTS